MLLPDDRPEPPRRPRHAAAEASFPPGSAGETARHRRPESLADSTRLRPISAVPLQRRAADALFDPGQFEDSFIERGYPEPSRARQRHDEAIQLAEQRRAQPRPRPRKRGERGRHAARHDLAITVRPLPVLRDAVADSLPVAKKAAGAIREWALYTGDKPPPTGSHRAPGTLPIESWLLVGKARQQALLATLAAAGVLLVVVPIQQHTTGTTPVSAAERAAAVAQGRGVPVKAPTGSAKHPAPAADAPDDAAPTTAPSRPTGKPTTSAPASAVPQGAGPANSLRTTGTTAVALTFDDGPDPVETPKILAMLARYDVKATFCLVGEQVEKHPEIVRQIVAAGHTLCNHTWNHSLVIGKQKPEQIQADLQRTNDAIHAAAPGAPIAFFRAPGGNFTDRLVQAAYTDGMTSLYWQVDPRDWDHPAGEDATTHVDKVVAGIKAAVKPGSIVLSHDFNQPDTIKAYEQLMPWLTKNFELGTPPQEAPPVTTAPTTDPPVSPEPAETPAAPEASAAASAPPGT